MGVRGRSGRLRRLTVEQEADLLARHALYLENRPKVLGHRFNLTAQGVHNYVSRAKAEMSRARAET